MEEEKISDKLAGHAPAKKVGGMRVPANRARNNSSNNQVVDDEAPTIKANLGGLDGNVVNTTKAEEEVVLEADVKSADAKKGNFVQKQAPVPKTQQSYKPVQQNINQPR